MTTEKDLQPLPEREAQIASYVAGEMTPDEAAAFARAMQNNPALAREVEQWREAFEAGLDWAESDAPGIERVAQLVCSRPDSRPHSPSEENSDRTVRLRSPQARVSGPPTRKARILLVRAVAWQAAAAAIFFVAGLMLGRQSGPTERPAVNAIQPMGTPIAQATPVVQVAPSLQEPTPEARPAASPEPERELASAAEPERELAAAPQRYVYRDEAGRYVVETTLAKSNTRATWVVDGSFQIAQNSLSGGR